MTFHYSLFMFLLLFSSLYNRKIIALLPLLFFIFKVLASL